MNEQYYDPFSGMPIGALPEPAQPLHERWPDQPNAANAYQMGGLAGMDQYRFQDVPHEVFGAYDRARAQQAKDEAQLQRQQRSADRLRAFAGQGEGPTDIRSPITGMNPVQQQRMGDAIGNALAPSDLFDAATYFNPIKRLGQLGRAVPAAAGVVLGADPAEAASAKAILSSTDVLDRLKPGMAEFWHRIANRKLDRRLQDIPYTESGQAPPMSSLVDPSTLVGKFLMPLPGDPTKRGKVIESVDNVKLSDPFLTEGGRAYIDELGGFANAPAAASAAAQRIKAIQDKFNTDVYGTYTKMGPQSADFSGHTWALLARMFPNAPMSKTGVANMDKAFRDEVAAIKPTKAMVKAGEEYVWPKQPPSVTADVFEQYLAGHPDMYRKAFINATEKARGTIPGVPDVIAARYAATDPTLLNARTNSSGLTMTKLTGATRPSTHPDYPVHLEGEGSFGLGQMLPREVMYPDLVRHFDKQGVEPNFWLRKMQMPPAEIPYGQLVTPEWAKNTTRYIDDTKQMGESAALNKYMLEHFGWK